MPADALQPYLAAECESVRARDRRRGPSGRLYPKGFANAARADAFPPNGRPPGGDLPFLREQLLDAWGIDYGILNCLHGGGGQLNARWGAAQCQAVNDWQVAEWLDPEPRLRASIVVHPGTPRRPPRVALCAGIGASYRSAEVLTADARMPATGRLRGAAGTGCRSHHFGGRPGTR